ncbi:transcriptional regulator [Candidatus Bathyarchaeota archaeon]|nr:MAG: transcriptional regulator [Candidatus Bathyarchaeota archaeon]
MRLEEFLKRLDPVLMNPNRLLIMAILYLFGPKKESEVVKALGMSWGKFSTHVAMLERGGYVARRKVFTRKGYRTFVKLTPQGRQAYRRLIRSLRELLGQLDRPDGSGGPGA